MIESGIRGIASRHQMSLKLLRAANAIPPGMVPRPGSTLFVRGKGARIDVDQARHARLDLMAEPKPVPAKRKRGRK